MNRLRKLSRDVSRIPRRRHFQLASTSGISLALVFALTHPAGATVVFDDSFERDFKPIWTRIGEAAVTTGEQHGFAYSYLSYPTVNTDPDVGVIIANLPAPGPTGFGSVWFLDDGGSGKEQFFQMRSGISHRPGIGVVDRISNYYVCSMVGQWDVVSPVPRSARWHEFRIEWVQTAAGVEYTMKIDGVTACTLIGQTLPATVNIGDSWSYVRTEGRGFWDDFYYGNQL